MAAEFDYSDVITHFKEIEQTTVGVLAKSVLAVKKTGHDTVTGAQAIVAVDTGNLKNTIGIDYDDDDMGFSAGPTAEYGADVEYGTRPHVIRPSGKKALFWEGAAHPVTRVNHPGTSPQPYMRPAFDRATAVFDQAIDRIVRDAF